MGLPTHADWKIVHEQVPACGEGEFVVKVDYLSIDPAMRAWMNAGATYLSAVELGEVMRGVEGHRRGKVDTTVAPAWMHLGVLGISGLTAYFGLLDIGCPQPGQTVLVSGAGGSVGSIAGQIARSVVARSLLPVVSRSAVGTSKNSGSITKTAGLRAEPRAHAPDVFLTTSPVRRWRPPLIGDSI